MFIFPTARLGFSKSQTLSATSRSLALLLEDDYYPQGINGQQVNALLLEPFLSNLYNYVVDVSVSALKELHKPWRPNGFFNLN